MTRASKSSSSSSRKGRGKRFDVFDFSEEDHHVEKVSRTLLSKFSAHNNSAVTKYQFLQCFAKDAESLSRNVSNKLIDIDAEVGKSSETEAFCGNANNEIIHIDSEVAKDAESLIRNVNNELIDIDAEVGKGAETDAFGENSNHEIIHIDSEVANAALNLSHQISNGPTDLDSEDTCSVHKCTSVVPFAVDGPVEDGSIKKKISETNALLLSRSLNNEDDVTVIFPDFVIYEDNCCTASKLIFSCSCIKLEGSAVNGLQKPLDSEWAISEIIGIESEWCRKVETAIVNLRLKGKDFRRAGNSNEISGIELLKFSVCDPLWSEREKAIRSLNLKYNDLWNANYNDKIEWEGIVSRGQNDAFYPMHCFSGFVEAFDEVIYPKGDPDAVTISKRDLELLKPGTFINDTIVDFYIKYLKNKFLLEESNRFYFFNSFFFRKLVDLDKDLSSACEGRAAFQRVHKWTKKVNIFEKDYIFIPVNYSLHWSLVVICHPGEVKNLKDKKSDNLSKVPCILHMDSIKGSHRSLRNLFQNYLREEWKERYGDGEEDVPSKLLALRFVSLELPQQENSFDCGLFLLHYVELFLEGAPFNFNPFKISKFSNFLNQDWFPPMEASLKRAHILQLIYEIRVNDHDKEFSGSIGKFPSSHVGDSNNYLSRQAHPGKAHASTLTCLNKFSSDEKKQENEMSTLLTCPLKHVRFREFGSVSKVSYDINYRKRREQSRSVMSPIEEDENGEIADSPQLLEDRHQDSANASECPSTSNFGSHREPEASWEGRFSRNVKDKDRKLPSPSSLGESQAISDLGRDHSLNHPTEAYELQSLSTSSEELITWVVEDSEECVVEDSEEANEMYDGIEIQSGNAMNDGKVRNNLFPSKQVSESTVVNISDDRQHDLLVSNEHPTTHDSSKQHSVKRPRVYTSRKMNATDKKKNPH